MHEKPVKRRVYFSVLIIGIGLLSLVYAFLYSSNNVVPVYSPSSTATFVASNTALPTFTNTPSLTPTFTPTLTSTSLPSIKAKILLSGYCYSGPSKNYLRLAKVPANSDVDILGTNGAENWSVITVPEHTGRCWIQSNYLTSFDTHSVPKFATAITAAESICRKYPSEQSQFQSSVPNGKRIVVYGKSNKAADWLLITPSDSTRLCWVEKRALYEFDYAPLSLIDITTPVATARFTEIPPTPSITPNVTLTLRAAFDDVDNQYESVKGSMVYIVPNEMKVGEEFDVQLVLQPFENQKVLSTEIAAISGLPTSTGEPGILVSPIGTLIIKPKSIEISKFMKATLITVHPDLVTVSDYLQGDDAIQDVSSTEPTRWHWKITANKEGTSKLILVVTRLVRYDQDDIWHEVDSRTETITVKVTTLQYLERLFKELNLLQILIGAVSAIVVGIVVQLLLARIKERQKATKAETSKKYVPFQEYLSMQAKDCSEITVSFDDIENILADKLPHSAEKIGWWLGEAEGKGFHKNAWLNAGWRVEDVDITGRKVTLKRK